MMQTDLETGNDGKRKKERKKNKKEDYKKRNSNGEYRLSDRRQIYDGSTYEITKE